MIRAARAVMELRERNRVVYKMIKPGKLKASRYQLSKRLKLMFTVKLNTLKVIHLMRELKRECSLATMLAIVKEKGDKGEARRGARVIVVLSGFSK